MQVLDQSYRIPKTIFEKSNNLVSRINKRINKTWRPREDEGQVRNTNFESIDLRHGQWLILGRTNYYINEVAQELKIDPEPRLNSNQSDKDYQKVQKFSDLKDDFKSWHRSYNSYDYMLYEEFCK